MTDFEPHFIPCIKHNCEHQKVDANCYPCSKCIQGTKWIHFKRAKTAITYESKDFSFDDMEKMKCPDCETEMNDVGTRFVCSECGYDSCFGKSN